MSPGKIVERLNAPVTLRRVGSFGTVLLSAAGLGTAASLRAREAAMRSAPPETSPSVAFPAGRPSPQAPKAHPTYYSGHRKRAEPSGSKSSRSRSAVASRSADRSGSVDAPQSIVSHSQSRHSVRKARTSGEVGSS